MIFKTSAIIILSFVAASASASVLDSASALVAGDGDEGVGSSNKGATRGGGMDIDLVGGGHFVPVDLSSSVAVGDGKVLKPSTVSSIDDIVDPLSIFPDKAMFVEANIDRLLKNNKTGKGAKNIKGGKKGKSKKEVDFPDSSDEEVNEQQCPIALFNGSYRYTSPCGKGLLVTIACGEDDDGGLGGDTCRYSERVVAQNACPESGLLNDEEEEDPCSVGGLFRQSENINYNADTDSCELAYFDFSEDRCELYLEEGGLGMKAVIHLSARQEMLLRFSFDSGETFYNEEAPRIAVVSPDVALYDTGRALSSDLIHAAKQRRLKCQACGDCSNISDDLDCESRKKSNYCEKSSDWHLFMLKNCRAACTPECNKKKCINNNQSCQFWKEKYFCAKSSVYHSYMYKNCPLACGVCKN